MTSKASSSRNRTYGIFLLIGALLTVALLVRQVFDLAADARVPVLRSNDISSVLGSVVVLAVIAFVFFGPVRKAKR